MGMNHENNDKIPPTKATMTKIIEKTRLFLSILVGLYIVFVVVSTIPQLSEFESMIIFGSILGSTIFVFYLMLGVEHKKRKKLEA